MKTFDIVVIGAGPAGVSAALRASSQGANVCLIEQDRIGAACFRKGLYPYKAAIAALNSNSFGININGVIDIGKLWENVKKRYHKFTKIRRHQYALWIDSDESRDQSVDVVNIK